jgi:DNA-binding response OmpR family regulator
VATTVRRSIKCPHCGKPFPLPSERKSPRFDPILRNVSPSTPKLPQVGDLVLNPDTYEVLRAGKEIVLSKTQFRLLESLMQESGRIVSRDVLAHSVWDSDGDLNYNLIDVSICNLRKKVDRNHNLKLIRTFRELGYSIRDSVLDS